MMLLGLELEVFPAVSGYCRTPQPAPRKRKTKNEVAGRDPAEQINEQAVPMMLSGWIRKSTTERRSRRAHRRWRCLEEDEGGNNLAIKRMMLRDAHFLSSGSLLRRRGGSDCRVHDFEDPSVTRA